MTEEGAFVTPFEDDTSDAKACIGYSGHIIRTGNRNHKCPLPNDDTVQRERIVRYDMWECWDCKRVWVYNPIPWEQTWVPLHWMNFVLRARLRNYKKRMMS